MRIQHNVAAMNSYRNFTTNNSALSKNLEKLSSGYKINRAGDDAAGLAVSEKMRAQITGLEGATKNAKDGIGMIQTAEGALQEVHDMLNRMYSLAEQSANGTYKDDVDRENLQMEVDSLKEEINRIGKTANFNGKMLFDGGSDSLLQDNTVLAIGDVADGDDNLLTLKFQDDVKLGAEEEDVTEISAEALGLGEAGDDDADVSVTDAGKAQTSMQKIKDAINAVSAFRGKLGAYQNRLDHTINNLGVMKENITDAESRIRDTDVAEEMMKYTKNNILNQSAQAMLAQANQMPQGVLQLLQ